MQSLAGDVEEMMDCSKNAGTILARYFPEGLGDFRITDIYIQQFNVRGALLSPDA